MYRLDRGRAESKQPSSIVETIMLQADRTNVKLLLPGEAVVPNEVELKSFAQCDDVIATKNQPLDDLDDSTTY